MEQVQHKFSADPSLIGSPVCVLCKMPKEAAIHTPKVQIVRGTATPKKIAGNAR